MYYYLLFFHSFIWWLVLISLLYSIYISIKAWTSRSTFSKSDNLARHLTATISHIQLTIGYTLYFTSPIIQYFRSNYKEASEHSEFYFFGAIHITLMTAAIIVITIGSSLSKRQESDRAKFKTMAIFFILALLIIFCAIPWPFSPLANRPYFRSF